MTTMAPPLKPAKVYIPPTGWSGHSLHDVKNLAPHTKIAWKISRDPSLLDAGYKGSPDKKANIRLLKS